VRILVGLCIVGVAGVAAAQPEPNTPLPQGAPEAPALTQTIRARVINALGRPVRNAKVSVEGSPDQVKTDRGGWFRIEASIGATLVVEADGYEVGLATVDKSTLDDIVLLTMAQTQETIEVQGDAPPPVAGAAKLDRQELQRVPGTGGDVVRALTVMPGVVNLQIPLGYSGVVIRGSSPQDSKVLIDDFEIPVLFHNIGFRALVPAEAIQTLDFIPGGYDVAYGRASSGIVSLTTRPGSDQRSTQAEISLIDGGLLAQGMASKKTRYMLGIRRSTIDFFLPKLIPDDVDLSLTTVPSYWDGQFRIDHELSSKWHLALSGVGTIDTFELYATKDTEASTKRFFNRTQFLRLTGSAKYHDGPWTANLALSGILPEFIFEAGAFQYIRDRQPAVTPRAEVTRTWDKAIGLTNVEWRGGGEAQVQRGHLNIRLPLEQREGEDQQMNFDPRDITTKFDGYYWMPDFAAWTAVSANLDPRIRATVGFRGDVFARNREFVPQPRAELKIKLTPKVTARLSSGAFARPAEFQSEQLDRTIEGERSTQSILGLEWVPREGARVQASTYYTDRTNLIVRGMEGTTELVNVGRGTTVGAELLATYRGGPWFAWLSYSYSHSTRVDHPGEDRRLFSYDQPHSLNASMSWLSPKKRWQLGGRFQLYSGLPYTPAIGSIFDSDRNIYIPVYGETNSERAPIHHQLDIRVDYNWKWGPTAMTAFLDVQNVYMNESIVTYFYSYDYTQRAAFKSIPIIPSIGLRGVL
jgi:hypothetical protein